MSQKPETPGRHTPASLNTCDIDDADEIVTGDVDTQSNRSVTQPPKTLSRHRKACDDYDVNDVKVSADIEAMLTEISGPPRHKRWSCPTEHKDEDPSCGTFAGDECELWKCHGCGATGSVIELGRILWPALDDRELINRVGRQYSGAAPSDRRQHTPKRQSAAPRQPKIENRAAEYEQARRPEDAEEMLKAVCAHRCWSVDIAISWCCEVVLGRRGLPALRVPYVFRGGVVYWKDRYLNADGSPMTKTDAKANHVPPHHNPGGAIGVPFGADRLDPFKYGGQSLFIVEGEADAITITETFGMMTPVIAFPGASNVGPRWLDVIEQWTRCGGGRRVFAVTDNDDPGEGLRETLSARLAATEHLYVPTQHNDVSDWLKATAATEVAEGLRQQTRTRAQEVAA